MTGSRRRPSVNKGRRSPMRSVLVRLAAVAAGVAIVASCDARLPTAATTPRGSGSTSSSSGGAGPSVVIDSPLAGALINVGDSILVTLHLSDAKGLKNASINGVTEKGSVDLGTYVQTPRYKLVTIPPTGGFRPGLRDTTIRRYIQPIAALDTAVDSLLIIAIATDSAGVADTAFRRVQLIAGPRV